jgi:hypothetical protein
MQGDFPLSDVSLQESITSGRILGSYKFAGHSTQSPLLFTFYTQGSLSMLGWWIIVSSQTPHEHDREADKSAILATWEASIGGTDWIKSLVSHGRAVQIKFGGYPCRYTASASDVLPLIKNGLPKHGGPLIIGDDYVSDGGWSGKITIHRDRITACPLDQLLTIDAWDQS